MFADDTNLFYSNSNINELLGNVNKRLAHVTDWCFANKLSINASKTKYIVFHKQTNRNNKPLILPDLKFRKIILKRVTELKFLSVMIDENLNW